MQKLIQCRLMACLILVTFLMPSATAWAQQFTLLDIPVILFKNPQWPKPLFSTAESQPPERAFPELSKIETDHVDKVLLAWETRSSRLRDFHAKFTRYTYEDFIALEIPSSISEGCINVEHPNKWSFKEDRAIQLVGRKRDGSGDYKSNPASPYGDWWEYDGKWMTNWIRNQKKVIRTEIPPSFQSRPSGALTLLTDIKVKSIKSQYYVRAVRLTQESKDVCLELQPKTTEEAGKYSRIEFVTANDQPLPSAIFIYMPNSSPIEAKNREHFVLELLDEQPNKDHPNEDQESDTKTTQDFRANLPSDWTLIEEPCRHKNAN